MAEHNPINPRKVLWSGENPGIYLQDETSGDWSSLGLFFRVIYSPFGPGCTIIVLEKPDHALGLPDAFNLCLFDNEELAAYLVREFVSKYPPFRGRKGLDAMSLRTIDEMTCKGDLRDYRIESVISQDLEVVMAWSDLSAPVAAEVDSTESATGEHNMYSVFIDAKRAAIVVNDRQLPGKVAARQFLGREMSTAFIAVSETWLSPDF